MVMSIAVCKLDVHRRLKKGNSYSFTKCEDADGEYYIIYLPDQYPIYILEDDFKRYFYTNQELRKLKLEKLHEFSL